MIESYIVILICEQSSVFTCMLIRKGSNLSGWLLLIVIMGSVPYRVAIIKIMKADYCSAKINRYLVLLWIHENFSLG